MVFIYGLIDPFTFKVKYIGKSIRPKQRLSNQCNEKSKTYRCNWIQSLLKKNKKPIQVILQTLNDDEDWQKAEKKWISIAKKYGWCLVNTTDGGDGVTNLSGDSKAKMLLTWKGRKHKPETILKLSKSSKGRVKTDAAKIKLSEKMKGREILWKDKLQEKVRKFDDATLDIIKKELLDGMKVIDAAKKYNVNRTTISKVKSGTYKTFKQKIKNYVKPRLFHNKKTNQK